MAEEAGLLQSRRGGDGSFSLWSERFGEAFHAAEGALGEARRKFVEPAELDRFPPGRELWVLECCVGTATNTAALLEAVRPRGLALRWWGLELDPRPLELALADGGFRAQWHPATLALLEQLRHGSFAAAGLQGTLLHGDARGLLPSLLPALAGRCDLVLMDAFSPGHCPELWSQELLQRQAALLAPQGRWLSYCSAAAVRQSLRRAGLQLATIRPHPEGGAAAGSRPPLWSAGTAASPSPLPPSAWLAPLSPMEREHLATRAAHPYRDPSGQDTAGRILERRQREQAAAAAESSGSWRRRWQLSSGGRR
ncbi:MAG: MnmC family methyltransferase [Prochlorococcaceae cyanobacterium]|jgi:tRNA U34 5-methylaminomethyl-2-thiouridine-forming methyltransferase MnmC